MFKHIFTIPTPENCIPQHQPTHSVFQAIHPQNIQSPLSHQNSPPFTEGPSPTVSRRKFPASHRPSARHGRALLRTTRWIPPARFSLQPPISAFLSTFPQPLPLHTPPAGREFLRPSRIPKRPKIRPRSRYQPPIAA